MTTPFEIPTSPRAQHFFISLAGTTYRLALSWCAPAACWILDLFNASDGSPFLTGIPLVTGADLIGQFAYLGIGGQIVAQTDHNVDAPPTYANLGSTGHLYFVVPG